MLMSFTVMDCRCVSVPASFSLTEKTHEQTKLFSLVEALLMHSESDRSGFYTNKYLLNENKQIKNKWV